MTEKDLEALFIKYLEGLGYKIIHPHSLSDIKENIRQKLSIINKNRLNGRELLAIEVDEILKSMNNDANENDSYSFSLNRRIHAGFRVPDLLSCDGSTIGIKLISDSPSQNFWEVASQVTDYQRDGYNNRYDVVIFLNGFP